MSWRDIGNPRAGGAERVTFEHMRRWVAAGCDVTLFTASYGGAAPSDIVDGVRIVRRGTEATVHLAAFQWYRRQRTKPDLVIDEIHGVPFCALAYVGVPVAAWIHEVARDIWPSMYPQPIAITGRLIESAALRWYGRQAVPFIAVSQSTRQDLSTLGVSAQQITVIEPAIDCTPIASPTPKERRPTLIYVGRLVRMKGVEDGLHALAALRHLVPNSQLWLVGAGSRAYVAELHQLAQQLGVQHAVQFLGRVSEEEKLRRLQRAHVLIHPSRREGWGINVIEANANGTPAVSYRVPGLRDSIVDGQTGLLCPYGQPAALADAAHALLAAPERYARLQRNALEWSRRFTWDTAAARSLHVLDGVAANRQRTAPPQTWDGIRRTLCPTNGMAVRWNAGKLRERARSGVASAKARPL